MGILSSAKDRVLEQLATAYLNGNLLGPYGRATSLRIDSTAKTLCIEAELKGEAVPLKIEVIDYEIRQDGERYFARVKEIRTSREWLTTLAMEHLRNVPFELPAQVGGLLARAL
ncbi:MAG TPA: hypothetical protein VFZ59_18275 [Verrucomicrobiae bacterium]|nr:hypothetical protein [Verrucomicrobiae bacterium]